MHTWHVVSNEVGIILGVYGEALLSEAQESARKISRESGCLTYLHHVLGERLHVGDLISMENAVSSRG